VPEVADAAAELARMTDEAEQLTAEHDQVLAAVVAPADPESRPPGNAAALDVVTTVHEGIRRLEFALLCEITPDSPPAKRRGGSDANTYSAIESVVRLCSAVSRHRADEVARLLGRWTAAAKRLPALDELARWIPLARDPGKLPPACQYCGKYSLRVLEDSVIIACLRPGCRDSDGNSPVGRLGFDKETHRPCLMWNDGTVQHPP
jgi:hypothetical protein